MVQGKEKEKVVNMMNSEKNGGKAKNGDVASKVKGVIEFHSLGKIPLSGFDDKTLEQVLKEIKHSVDVKKEEQIQTLKKVIKHQNEKIKKIEGVLEKYGYSI